MLSFLGARRQQGGGGVVDGGEAKYEAGSVAGGQFLKG